jgi:hypothetical protein
MPWQRCRQSVPERPESPFAKAAQSAQSSKIAFLICQAIAL